MSTKEGRRSPGSRALIMFAAALLLGLTAGAAAYGAGAGEADATAGYEIWALDQGTNIIHIVQPDDSAEAGFSVFEQVDLGAYPDAEIDMPHMIDFTQDYEYAVIASPASANTTIIRTSDRQVVAVLDTGAGTHMASFTPDDSRIIVDVIAEGTVVEIDVDLENERFEIARTLKVSEAPLVQERSDVFSTDDEGNLMTQPICHDYANGGRHAYITLGPGLADGGLIVLDLDSFDLVAAYGPEEVSVNCGTVAHPQDSRFYLNGGSVDEGHWYVFNTETHEPIADENGDIRRSSGGRDAHGVWYTPDGSELWMVNRASSDGIVIDPNTDAVIDTIEWTGQSPDILTFSPDGAYAFVTLRGPEQRSGPHAIAGDTPGISIMDVATREVSALLILDPDTHESDFHGIGMRQLR